MSGRTVLAAERKLDRVISLLKNPNHTTVFMESQQASDREGTRLKLLQQQFNYLMMYRGSGQIAASDALVICKH